ncbi:MAG: hypothetical protein AAF772_12400 [Acidobacteriota bacterium]
MTNPSIDVTRAPQQRFAGTLHAAVSALALGALSTFGDWLWTHYIPDGAIVPGVAHGVIVFLVMACLLAWAGRAWVPTLLVGLPIAGAVIAALFYPLYAVLGYLGALLVTWIAMWLVTALLQRRARGNRESLRRTLVRGGLAALGSGLAFAAIAGIWTNPSPDGPNYLWHFVCWSFAFAPGFAALLVDPR